MNLELRHKLTIDLIRLLVKKKNQADQPNSRPKTLNSIRLGEIMYSIGLE